MRPAPTNMPTQGPVPRGSMGRPAIPPRGMPSRGMPTPQGIGKPALGPLTSLPPQPVPGGGPRGMGGPMPMTNVLPSRPPLGGGGPIPMQPQVQQPMGGVQNQYVQQLMQQMQGQQALGGGFPQQGIGGGFPQQGLGQAVGGGQLPPQFLSNLQGAPQQSGGQMPQFSQQQLQQALGNFSQQQAPQQAMPMQQQVMPNRGPSIFNRGPMPQQMGQAPNQLNAGIGALPQPGMM